MGVLIKLSTRTHHRYRFNISSSQCSFSSSSSRRGSDMQKSKSLPPVPKLFSSCLTPIICAFVCNSAWQVLLISGHWLLKFMSAKAKAEHKNILHLNKFHEHCKILQYNYNALLVQLCYGALEQIFRDFSTIHHHVKVVTILGIMLIILYFRHFHKHMQMYKINLFCNYFACVHYIHISLKIIICIYIIAWQIIKKTLVPVSHNV